MVVVVVVLVAVAFALVVVLIVKTAKVLIIQKFVKYLFYGFDLDFLWIELMKNLCLPNLFMVLI